jgi:hypothetical protein
MKSKLFLIAACGVLLCTASPATADSIVLSNGDFQTGTLAGWTVFTTSAGTNGSGLPDVSLFDTTGTGASLAAHFDVGGAAFPAGPQGGGLRQSVVVPATGLYSIAADIASRDDASGQINGDAGTFMLLVDGGAVSSRALGGFTSPFEVLRGSLIGSTLLSSGVHTLTIEITRAFLSSGVHTPDEFVDNVSIQAASPTPEPTTLLLLGSSLAMLVLVTRRNPCQLA